MFSPVVVFAFDFKGIEIGSKTNTENIEDELGITCRETSKANGFYCTGDTTIAGGEASISIFLDKDYTVETIKVKFLPVNFEDVKIALLDKFGKPKLSYEETLQNVMGAEFIQQRVSWQNKTSYMYLDKYDDKIDESSLFFATNKFSEEAEKHSQKKKGDI